MSTAIAIVGERGGESYLKAGGNTRLNASKNARYDLAGNATNFANQTLTYNNRGRLASDLVGTNNSTHVYSARADDPLQLRLDQ
jgi:hypothetical protein